MNTVSCTVLDLKRCARISLVTFPTFPGLHEYFYGGMTIHIQSVTASTIMGTIKFAFVPRVYSTDFIIEQSTLDALNAIEIACNVNGEGTIRCIPTSDEYARTGVYRRSAMSDSGRLIGITATNIYNSFAANVEVQIKIACSLMEGSKYIMPSLLRSDIPSYTGAADLNLATEDARAILIVDGQHHDGVDYGIGQTGLAGKTRLECMEGTTVMEVASYPKMTTFKAETTVPDHWSGEMYPIDGHTSIPFPDIRVKAFYEAKDTLPDTGAYFSTSRKEESVHWLQWMNAHMHGVTTIAMTNVALTPNAKGGSIVLCDAIGKTTPASKSALFGEYVEKVGSYMIDRYDPHIVDIDNHGHFYLGTFRSFRVAETDAFHTVTDVRDKTVHHAFWPPLENCVATHMEITGIPIDTTTAQVAGIVPATYWNCKIADSHSIIPTVTTNGIHWQNFMSTFMAE